MEENNNNKLVILVGILSILVLALCGYIIYDKVISKPEQKNEEQTNITNNNTNNQNEEINSSVVDKKENASTEDNDGNEIDVYFTTTSGTVENVISELKINGKDVLNSIETKDIFTDSEITYEANSKIAAISIEEYSTGYINHHLYIFDSNGKLLKSIDRISDSDFDYGYGFKGKFKLNYTNSTIEYEMQLVYDETGCGYEYKGNCFTDLSKDQIKNLGSKEDITTYEINYLDNGTLSDPKKKNSTMLKDNENYKSYLK